MRRLLALTAIACAIAVTDAAAHPAPFSYLDVHLSDSGLAGSLIVHDLDVAHDVGVERPERLLDLAVARQYEDVLTRLMNSRLTLLVDGRRAALTWTGLETLPERQSLRLTFRAAGTRPARVRVDGLLFPYDPIHQTFINVYEDGRLHHQAIIAEGRQTADYYAGTWQGAAAVLAVFAPAGIEHILIGPDHVLFLVGLLLLGGTLWRLATIVTAFTIGHSITLSLAALDVVSPPASIVEPVIALSIVVVGADNLLVQRERTSAAGATDGRAPRDIRPWVAGVFGLVHGFGFATVLKEFGLPLTALGWSLFSFNLGVEIGQLVIVLAVALALRSIERRLPAMGRRLVVAGSVIVMAAGTYWFVQRVFLTGGA
jgi:hydrogenase/urease accessory protein HupE